MRRVPHFTARPSRWLAALALSLLVHAGLVMGPRPELNRASALALTATPVLQTRTLVTEPAVMAAVEPAAPRPGPAHRSRSAATRPAPPQTLPAVAALVSFRVPPAADIRYRLRQMGREGTARLRWQPQDDGGYQLSLERELAGRDLPGWRSEGQIVEGSGLAPSRYTQQRAGRDARATNFRRDEGRISFSASAEQFALPDGVQDRLSWWLHLAALIAAAPERYPPGSELRLNVVGLRGEAREWVFEVLGLEPVALAEGQSLLPALHLRRAPLGAYDAGVELWLAPDRGHLPVRVLVGQQDERGWELLLVPTEQGQ